MPRASSMSSPTEEYFDEGHAEPIPTKEKEYPCREVFYLPKHAVVKPSSTIMQLRVVFDASSKTKSS